MADGDDGGTQTVTETPPPATDDASKPVTHGEFASLLHEGLEEALAPFKALLGGGGKDGTNQDGEPVVKMTMRDVEQFAEGVVAKAVKKLKIGAPVKENDESGKSGGAGSDTGGDGDGAGKSSSDSVAGKSTDTAGTTATAAVREAAPIGDAKRLAKQERRWGSA